MSKSGKKREGPKDSNRAPTKSNKKSLENIGETQPQYSINDYDKKNKDKFSSFPGIGQLSETTLHSALKHMLAKPGDTLEAKVGGKVVDILTSTGDIVEIQTGNFGKIRDKVRLLSQDRRIRIVHPVIGLRIIVQLDAASGAELSRRKSPKRESYYSIFEELIHFPDLFDSGNLQLEVMLVEVEELRTKDGQGSWRRRFQSILDKRLSTHTGTMVFERKQDLLRLLPQKIHNGFTSSELALETGIPMSLAQKMAYVLKKNGLIKEEGRRKRAYVYSVSSEGD